MVPYAASPAVPTPIWKRFAKPLGAKQVARIGPSRGRMILYSSLPDLIRQSMMRIR